MQDTTTFVMFLRAYLQCALWLSNDPETDEPLDTCYSVLNFTSEGDKRACKDCQDFLEQAKPIFDVFKNAQAASQMGHDFWLSRNGHGTGFFPRDYVYGEDAANKLQELASSFGSLYVLPSDDRELYFA